MEKDTKRDENRSAVAYAAYAYWRFNYYYDHGGMTYQQIDDAVARGEIKVGDTPPKKAK